MASAWLAGADEGAEMLISGLVNSGPILGYVYTKTSGKPHKVIRSSANIREVNRVYADIPEGDRQSCRTAIVNVQTACVHHELLCCRVGRAYNYLTSGQGLARACTHSRDGKQDRNQRPSNK